MLRSADSRVCGGGTLENTPAVPSKAMTSALVGQARSPAPVEPCLGRWKRLPHLSRSAPRKPDKTSIVSARVPMGRSRWSAPLIALLLPLLLTAADAEWAVNGGPYNIRYSTLAQITPANVARLKVAWTYDSQDSFKDSE